MNNLNEIDADSIHANVPLAVYRLGYLSIATRMWQEELWDLAGAPEFDDGFMLAIDQLDHVIVILSKYIDEHLIHRIDKAIDRHKKFIESIMDQLRYFRARSVWPSTTKPPHDESWEDIKRLADNVFSKEDFLRPLYDAGFALGQYQFLLKTCIVADPDDPNNLPDVTPLVQVVSNLPEMVLTEIPWFNSMKEISYLLSDGGTARFFDQYISQHESDWGDLMILSNHHHVRQVVSMTDRLTQERLGGLDDDFIDRLQKASIQVVVEPISSETKPSFKRVGPGYELRYAGKLARSVSIKGVNIIKLFEAFENANWSERIANPFLDPNCKSVNSVVLHETLRSANNLCEFISFHGDGAGTGAIWKPSSSP